MPTAERKLARDVRSRITPEMFNCVAFTETDISCKLLYVELLQCGFMGMTEHALIVRGVRGGERSMTTVVSYCPSIHNLALVLQVSLIVPLSLPRAA